MSNALRKKMALRRDKSREATLELAPVYCEGKRRFPTMAAALSQFKYGKKFDRGGPMKLYQCAKCHGYHQGRSIGRKQRPEVKERHSWDDERLDEAGIMDTE